MNLFQLLSEQASRTPDRTAMIDGRCGRERIISFRSLQQKIDGTADQLARRGLGPNSQVLILVPMQTELYITLAALWKIGATALFLDPSAGRKYIANCCDRTRPDAVIAVPKARILWWVNASVRRIPLKLIWGKQLSFEEERTATTPPVEVPDAHPAILTFTSGSTGQPKGAIRSHGLLYAQYQALGTAIALKVGEVELATMPIIALVNLAAGITTLIPDADLKRPGFVRTEKILQQIERFRPDRCVASPAFLARFPLPDNGQLDSFKKIYTGGAPAFPSQLGRLQQVFRKASIVVLYGSTEAEPISHIDWAEVGPSDRDRMAAANGLLVGHVAPESDIQIISDAWGKAIPPQSTAEWTQRALAPGEIGEIVVAGKHVIPGYLGGIGDSDNKVYVDGHVWHRTGDAGYVAPDGKLWLMGRCAARFQVEDRWIYPFAVECAAVEYFKVPIAACCAINGEPILFLPESHSGELPNSFTCGDITIRSIKRRKIPIDKRHNAKVDYAKLRR